MRGVQASKWEPPIDLVVSAGTTPDLIGKFSEMSRAVLPEGRENEIVHLVLDDFERLQDLEPLVRLLGSSVAQSRVVPNPEGEGVPHA